MKKIISALLVTVMLLIASVPALAIETVDISENSSNFSCIFNEEKNIIRIKGNINHDVLVKYGDYTICIYKIPFEKSYTEAISDEANRVISHAPISIRFEYTVPISDIEDRFVKYALVLVSPQGKMYLASDMRIPAIENDYEYTEMARSGFKGIEIDNISLISNLAPGTVFIDLDLDSLYGNASNCYLYPMGDTFAYIDKAVISELDSKIMTLSQSGAHIYLRFLMRSDGRINTVSADIDSERAPYTIPDVYYKDTLDFICAASSFLAEHYNGGEVKKISGVILGTKIDDVENVNYTADATFDEYVDKYVIYMLGVANSMRSIDPKLDIVVPVSDANDYTPAPDGTDAFYVSELIEGIISRIEEHLSDASQFTLLLEIDNAPFGISNDNLNRIIDTSPSKEYNPEICVENIDVFDNYFKSLSEKFDGAPLRYSILWNASETLTGNALACAYAYSYYKLFSMNNVASFIVSFGAEENVSSQRFDELSNIFKYIDTEMTFDVTENILKYFGVASWSQILVVKKAEAYAVKTYYDIPLLDELPVEATGRFDYFDFSLPTDVHEWKNGINTKSIKADYTDSGIKALHINSEALACGDSFEVYYLYDPAESFSYTPYLVLDVGIDALGNEKRAALEVTVTLGNDNSIAFASKAIATGDSGSIILDISDFSRENSVQYLKISARALTDDVDSISMWIDSISGHSSRHDSEALASLINAERQRTQDEGESLSEEASRSMLTRVIIVAAVIIMVGVGVFILFKKEDEA